MPHLPKNNFRLFAVSGKWRRRRMTCKINSQPLAAVCAHSIVVDLIKCFLRQLLILFSSYCRGAGWGVREAGWKHE